MSVNILKEDREWNDIWSGRVMRVRIKIQLKGNILMTINHHGHFDQIIRLSLISIKNK